MTAQKDFNIGRNSSLPAIGAVAITPADADLAENARGLYVNTGGTLVLTFADSTGPFTITVPDASILPFCVKRVALASTATGILGLR